MLICFLFLGARVAAQTCGNPGNDGPVTISGIVNTYYPGAGTVSAGATSISVGVANGSNTQINAGDLVLIIQMQNLTMDLSNTAAYGVSSGGTAGQFEFGVAAQALSLSGGTLQMVTGLKNAYSTAGATNRLGQKTFQVVRVPQYSSAIVSGNVTTAAWDGSTGGIVAIDVAGNLNLAGGAIDASGLGFRGAGGVNMQGGSGASSDYRSLSTNGAGGSKGEGIAGTPRYVFDGFAVNDNTTEGYPNGSFDRGAPGNAGGGGTDANPSANDQNTGGGGGGNGGAGGNGGNSWNTNQPFGGIGGRSFTSPSAAQIAMGGGGGAGTTNNTVGYRVSGGAGGGAVIIRAGSVSGGGTINANGSVGQTADQDGGGGGGAGGAVIVTVKSGTLSGLTINATGGNGGNTWMTVSGAINYHGPGGGGGGGVVLQSSGAFVNVTQGSHGVATLDGAQYGSADGVVGISSSTVAGALSGTSSGAQCVPVLTVTKLTTTASRPQGSTATYTITAKNASGVATATKVNLSDVLPQPVTNGFTYKANVTVTLSGGALRPSTTDPTAASITPNWGVFSIPANGQVDVTFTVNVAGNVPPATYQNPATATYLDPGRTTSNGTTSASYNPASSTAEDVTVTPTISVSGYVYGDTNHDGNLDSGETWTGATVYVNLVLSGAVVQSAQVTAGAGSFTFTNVSPGSYTLVLASSAIATTGTIPAGWILTSPSTASVTLTVGTTSLLNQNFALFKGNRLTGRVFRDSGSGAGIANDGKLNGAEKGLSAVAMMATDGSNVTYDSTSTDGAGSYTLWIPSLAQSVSIIETKVSGYVSTGADVGNTGGTYNRPSDTIVFSNSAGTTYSGVNFGDVLANTFNPNNAQSGLPGTVLLYAHTFKAATSGQIVFSTSATASPARNNFAEVLYRDFNCNGNFDSGDLQVTAAVSVNEGDTVCLIVKEMISLAAPFGSTNSISVSAQFAYINSSPALVASYFDSDVTTVGSQTSAGLRLVKTVDKLIAKSGDTLLYNITYFNDSSGPLSNVVINDATPAYTTFSTATCVIPLPGNLTDCIVDVHPLAGGLGPIRWTAVGTLAPSTSGQVTFTVKIQ